MMVQNIPKGALPMNRLRRTITVAGLFGLALVSILSFARPTPVLAEVTGDYDVIQLMLEFRPGAWTPPHTHGGYILVSPQDGEMTVRDSKGVEKKYKTGESFVEAPGAYLEIGNASTSGVHVAVVALLPKGAVLTTNKDGAASQNPPPGPTTIGRTQMAVTNLHDNYDVIQLVLEFRPGAWTPPHTHGGYILGSPLDGEVTVRDSQGVEKKYKTGESFVEAPGAYIEVGNASTSAVHVAAVALLPKGAVLTTNKDGATSQNPPPGPTTIARTQMSVTGAPTALPKTGADASPDNALVVALGGLSLLALGWAIRRRSSPG
jgi:LPXTG-motif cell wall-anchored protein